MDTNEKKGFPKGSLIKIIIIAAIFCSFAGMLAAVFVFVTSGSETNKLKKQLELGEKYLNEMDYDNAILAYEKALEIDPKSIEAYKGIMEAYSEKGDIEKVLEWADNGYNATQNPLFLEISEEYTETTEIPSDPTEVEEDSLTEDNKETVYEEEKNKPLKKIKKESFFDAEGNPSGYNDYDENGDRVLWDQGDGVVHMFEFDEKHNVVKQTTFYSDLDYTSVWTMEDEYDSDGNFVKETSYHDGQLYDIYEMEYDISNYLSFYRHYSADGKLIETIKVIHDADGNELSWLYYNVDGTLSWSLETEYDDFGNPITKKTLDSDLNIQNYTEYINEYDSNGNLMKSSSCDSEGKLTGWTEYEYYDSAEF